MSRVSPGEVSVSVGWESSRLSSSRDSSSVSWDLSSVSSVPCDLSSVLGDFSLSSGERSSGGDAPYGGCCGVGEEARQGLVGSEGTGRRGGVKQSVQWHCSQVSVSAVALLLEREVLDRVLCLTDCQGSWLRTRGPERGRSLKLYSNHCWGWSDVLVLLRLHAQAVAAAREGRGWEAGMCVMSQVNPRR